MVLMKEILEEPSGGMAGQIVEGIDGEITGKNIISISVQVFLDEFLEPKHLLEPLKG